MENLQGILLFIAGLTYSQAVLYVQKSHRLLPLGGALLCLSFLLRELDVEKFDLPGWIILLGSGYGRNILLISLCLLVVVLLIKNHKHYLPAVLNLLSRKTGIFAILGGFLLVLGSLFDDELFDVKLYQFYEELTEMNGYYFILLSALNLCLDLSPRSSQGNFTYTPADIPK
ncbi:MAG: hypothetical protein ACXWTN_09050 [Methylosarcina sp.]